jgi:CHAT domain-containing protein/tetratricopeptide (TPR) repeat protein
MGVSYSEKTQKICPVCQAQLEVEVWFIVDMLDDPYLAEDCHRGTIHTFTCPNNHKVTLDAHLLVYNSAQNLAIFSVPEFTTKEEDEKIQNTLMTLLSLRLPTDSRNVPMVLRRGVTRRMLPYLMDGMSKEEISERILEPLLKAIDEAGKHQDFSRCIDLCEQLLPLVQRKADAASWASICTILADSLIAAKSNTKLENTERAIQLYKEAFSVYTRDEYALDWAKTKYNLGLAYYYRSHGNRAENLEDAIHLLNEALDAISQNSSPEEWARIQNDLGLAYSDRIRGEKSQNLEIAIEHYESALNIFTRDDFPSDWATVKTNLGLAYWERIQGERADNLEHATQVLEDASKVHAIDSSPERWADIQHNLGLVYVDRIRGSHAENIETAILLFKAALDIYSREDFPKQWGRTQNSLGTAYRARTVGHRSENIERAIEAFNHALSVHSRDRFLEFWANAQHNLGTAYTEKIKGDRAENFEHAIQYFVNALTVRTFEDFPVNWAKSHNGLGTAYLRRIRGNREDNLEEAIRAFESSLRIYSRESFPEAWASVQINLGITFFERIKGDRAENLEKSIEYYRNAQNVFAQESLPENWAKLQNNLANVYRERIHGERGKNLETAIELFKSSLSVLTRTDYPEVWAGTHFNMATTYKELKESTHSDNVSRAKENYKASLEVYLPHVYPKECRNASASLATIYLEEKDWSQAYSTMLVAVAAAENLYAGTQTEEGKIVEIKEHAQIFQNLVEICLNLDPPRYKDALFFAEEGRSRLLRDQLGAFRLPSPSNVPEELIEQERELLDTVRGLESALRAATDGISRRQLIDEAMTIRTQIGELWDSLAQDYGAKEYIALRRGEKFNWDHIQQWLPTQGRQTAIVEFFMLSESLIAFIIRDGDSEPDVIRLFISPEELEQIVQSFFDQVHGFDPNNPKSESWLEDASHILSDIMPRLKDIDLLYLIPHRLLHYLPLHALEYNGEPLIFYYPVSYAPSISVLLRISHPSPSVSTSPADSLVVGNPTGDLDFAEEEAIEVAKVLLTSALLKEEATKTKVIEELGNCARIHIAGHAYFDEDDPLKSGIILSGDEILTVLEVMAQSNNAHTIVLSGCETGMHRIGPGDELVGFGRAFLYSGISSLIISLWEVDDVSTATLMQRFYELSLDVNGNVRDFSVDALRNATLEVKEDWPETFYWAPFILFGNWR